MEALWAELDPLFLAKTTAEWIARLEAEDQICSPVQSYQEVAHDPAALENGYIIEIEHPRMGRGKVVTVPFEFHGTPLRHDTIDPQIGEHTREILAAAGLSAEQIESLIANRIARCPHSETVP
jgi:crotonobetainyl-CoA:carnitine CoA-transferase CaiB-like acyl-CoA transferase